jgi:hypothetical protein
MEADILPALGNSEITEITPSQAADVVLAIESRCAEDVARRALRPADD